MRVANPKEAELNAAEKLVSWGYLDAVSPEHGADGGVDVRSSRAIAQVKFREKKAGRPELQNLVGAREGDTTKALMFFDLKGYSREATDYANRAGIGLYTYDKSGAVRSVNSHAQRLMGVSWSTRLTTALKTPGAQVISLLLLGVVLLGILFAIAR